MLCFGDIRQWLREIGRVAPENINEVDLVIEMGSPLTWTAKDVPPAENPPSEIRSNLLLPHWKDGAQKNQVIAQVARMILGTAANTSEGCMWLLPFLLSYEGMNMGGILKEKIESQQVRDLTSGLARIADAEAERVSHEALVGFRKFMDMRRGDQLLAMIELRNILEKWVMSPQSSNNSPYDLTEFRNDLRWYFRPQQWEKTEGPSAQDMYDFAYAFSSNRGRKGADTRDFLRTMAWLLRAASARYAQAEASVGYYFAECGDSRRYLYWTEKAARQGCGKALFNLGTSYARGSDGVKQHYQSALKYFLMAEKNGTERARAEIGLCYMNLRAYNKAKRWLDKAGQDEYAYCTLGWMYEKGLGVPQSRAVALGYYLTAGDMGLEFIQQAAERLRGKPILFEPQKDGMR
jgi:tetratricopeptide (TPR) repeat protein